MKMRTANSPCALADLYDPAHAVRAHAVPVLLFGSVASVWCYCRIADMLTWLTCALALVPTLHFVDDFGAAEAQSTADSGFQACQHVGALSAYDSRPQKLMSHRLELNSYKAYTSAPTKTT